MVEGRAAGYLRGMVLAHWPVLVALFLGPPDAAGWQAHVETLSATPGAEAALRLAGGLGRRGELAAARRWAAEARSRGADALRVRLVLADAAYVAEDWVPAASGYFEVLREAPENPHALVQLWHCIRLAPPTALARELDVGRLRDALETHGMFVPSAFQYPPDLPAARARVEAGFADAGRGDHDAAGRAFREAIAVAPSSHEAWRGLGLAEAAAGRAAHARAAYLIYLSLEPPETLVTRRIRRVVIDAARRRGLEVERSRRRTP
jgi:tetratricopeptide (TPR) repeat protein